MSLESTPENIIIETIKSLGGSCPLVKLNAPMQKWCSMFDRNANNVDVRNEAIAVLLHLGLVRCYDVRDPDGGAYAQPVSWICLTPCKENQP